VSLERAARHRAEADRNGQAVAEFALVLIPFLFLLFGVFDLGRGVYQFNAVSEAAREIARVTIVHPYTTCCTLGSSSEAQAVIQTQKAVVPGLTDAGVTIVCVDLADTVKTASSCRLSDFIRVTVHVSWSPASPLLAFLGVKDISSVSRMQLQWSP
jgi:Flp pilus assembly protein TadG